MVVKSVRFSLWLYTKNKNRNEESPNNIFNSSSVNIGVMFTVAPQGNSCVFNSHRGYKARI